MKLSDWLGVAGLVVSVFGFGIAIWQLNRTANATEATAAQIGLTLHRMNVNHLLVLLPQLRMIENDLDEASIADDRRLAKRTLVSYAQTASQVASLLEVAESESDADFVKRLRSSARLASLAKAALVSSSRGTVKSVTRELSTEIGEISGLAAGAIAQYQSKVA